MSIFWGEHTHEEIAEASRESAVVVLPVGACEQHGPHLPVDTDIFQATEYAAAGARYAVEKHSLRVLLLPTIPYGDSSNHEAFVGTVFLPTDLLVRIVGEVLMQVAAQGFRRLVIVSGHGGNHPAISLAARNARRAIRTAGGDAEVFHFHEGHRDGALRHARREDPAAGSGNHAGGMETSLCLAKRESLVRRERIRPPKLRKANYEAPIYPARVWMTDELTDSGSFGDPTGGAGATAAAGKTFWRAIGEDIGEFLKHVADYDPNVP